MIKNIGALLIIGLCSLITACNSTPKLNRPVTATNYEKDLSFPDETDRFILVGKKIFDDPRLGILLSYSHKSFPEDFISVYVYPIMKVDWKDVDNVLMQEMEQTLKGVDAAISNGRYKSKTPAVESEFSFTSDDKLYKGKKAKFKIVHQNDIPFYSNTFLFIDKDKYIKFRTSFNASQSREVHGDSIVKALLPLITVPDESEYMRQLRAEHQKKLDQQFMNLLMQSIQKQAAEKK